MRLSTAAAAFLNALLMEAADRVEVGDGYVNVLDRPTAEEIRARLQVWRDELEPAVASGPAAGVPELVSGALVHEAEQLFQALPDVALLAQIHPNDAQLGAELRALAGPAGQLHARISTLLREALDR